MEQGQRLFERMPKAGKVEMFFVRRLFPRRRFVYADREGVMTLVIYRGFGRTYVDRITGPS